MSAAPVVVIGGGSTGCSVLYHLAKRGVKGPVLVEAGGQVGGGQTSRSTALVRTHYSTEILTTMALKSYAYFRDFGREVPGRTAGYVETGLIVGGDDASERGMRKNVELYRRLGIDSQIVDSGDLAALEPMLRKDAFTISVYEPHAGYAEPSTTAVSLASAARDLGAKVITGASATGLKRTATGYTVSTSGGEIECQSAIIATGVWSKPLFERLGIKVPLRIVRHPVAAFVRPPEYQGRRPIIFDFPRESYYKPEGRSLLFTGTLGLEADAAPESDPDRYDQGITDDERDRFSSLTMDPLPIMAKGTVERGYSGLYDNTPDQHPIIDEFAAYGFPGLRCVVGLSGHGFKLAPEFGRIAASMVVDGEFRDYDVSVFRLNRFEQGRMIKGNYPVSTIG